ncbi:MAG: hypothetical protein EOM68_00125 [Spirochaetia bacterium]|nr:hypothetical protein [Spirochaetia bacterium]
MSDYLIFLMNIKSCPKTFSSDYARREAGMVAEAASRGHITALSADGTNQGAWEITARGALFIEMNGGYNNVY